MLSLFVNLSQLESCALNDVYFVAFGGLQWAAVSATTVLFPLSLLPIQESSFAIRSRDIPGVDRGLAALLV